MPDALEPLTADSHSQALLRMACRLGRIGAWRVELPAFTLTLSDEVRAIHEMPPDRVPTIEEGLDSCAPEFREAVASAFEACARDGTPYDIDLDIITGGGRRVRIRLLGEAQRDDAGIIRRVQGVIQDMTDVRPADEGLKERNEQFRLLVNNITDAFWIRSPDMRKVYYVSPAFEQIWGRPTAALYADPERWSDFVVEEDREPVRRAFATLAGDVPTVDIEYRIRRPDGAVRWVRARGFQVRDATDQLIRLTGIVTDITEQKRIGEVLRQEQATLRESEERFSGAFEHAPIGVALVSPDGRWLRVNRALCEMVGYSAAELLTLSFQDITLPDDLQGDMEQVRRLLAGDIRFYQIEKRYIHKRGHLITVMLSVSLVRDEQGHPRYFISQIEDVTERKRLEAQLFQSQKMETVGRLAGGVAHEFNSLLTIILGYSDFLRADLPAGSPLSESVEEISRAAGRAAALTRQLLAYGRKQILQHSTFDLNQAIVNLSDVFGTLLGGQTQRHFSPGAGSPAVTADAGQIEQVIVNMVINARDAMPNGGTLTLATENVTLEEQNDAGEPGVRSNNYVMLAITDTGVGMSDDVKARIFEPFFTTKSVGKGAGLGLSTSYGIVKQSGGHITVHSEPGRGTTFRIYLPQA